MSQEFGASVRITSLALEGEDYVITKQLFCNLIQIRYG